MSIEEEIKAWESDITFIQTAILRWMNTHPNEPLLQLMCKYPTADVLCLGADYTLYYTILAYEEIGLDYDDIQEDWGCAVSAALNEYKDTLKTLQVKKDNQCLTKKN